MAIDIRARLWAACLLCGLLPSVMAGASDLNPSAPPPSVVLPARAPAVVAFDKTSMYELRFGAFAHSPGFSEGNSPNADINAELVFPRLPLAAPAWVGWFVPRPMVGVMANTANKTSFAYVSMVWTWEWNRFFVEPIFGAAFHNGYYTNPPPGHLALGCSPLFHTGISVGYYLNDRWSVMGTWQHISNGGLCDRNLGLNTYGLRVGYSFSPW